MSALDDARLMRDYPLTTYTAKEARKIALGLLAILEGNITEANAPVLAARIHYPECWDTAAYPTIESALREIIGDFKCSECVSEDSTR